MQHDIYNRDNSKIYRLAQKASIHSKLSERSRRRCCVAILDEYGNHTTSQEVVV